MQKHTVLFQPDNIKVEVTAGIDLLTASRQANLQIKCGCGGDGTCGKCLIKLVGGTVIQKSQSSSVTVRHGYYIACQTIVHGDVTVEIPPFSRLTGQKVLLDDKINTVRADCYLPPKCISDPLCKKITLQLSSPKMEDPTSDASRLLNELKKFISSGEIELTLLQVQQLSELLRSSNWHVDVTIWQTDKKCFVLAIEPHDADHALWGLSIDVGTTTVAVHLIDLITGTVKSKAGTHNKQSQYGDDVITRVIYSTEEHNGLKQLQHSIVSTINGLIAALIAETPINPLDIRAVVCAGNTIMGHFLLGIDPRHIRLEPYVPVTAHYPLVKASEIGLNVYPDAVIYNFPAVASYVGGDIVAGTMVTGLTEEEPVTLFIDIGTNGEMVLGNKEWLVACSCSAGPSFEGSGITYGMRAMQGAIERIEINCQNYEVTYSTIGNVQPQGICGSGLIDALAKMRKAGLIDRAGKFQDVKTPRMRPSDNGPEFVLAWKTEAASVHDITITEADVKNLLRAKAAIYAGIRCLLKSVDVDLSEIERIYIAGGFGSYLNIPDAVEIGLLPDLPTAKYQFVGNTSLKGASAAFLSTASLAHAQEISERINYVELSYGNSFMNEFIAALFLPHTDLSLFPSVNS